MFNPQPPSPRPNPTSAARAAEAAQLELALDILYEFNGIAPQYVKSPRELAFQARIAFEAAKIPGASKLSDLYGSDGPQGRLIASFHPSLKEPLADLCAFAGLAAKKEHHFYEALSLFKVGLSLNSDHKQMLRYVSDMCQAADDNVLGPALLERGGSLPVGEYRRAAHANRAIWAYRQEILDYGWKQTKKLLEMLGVKDGEPFTYTGDKLSVWISVNALNYHLGFAKRYANEKSGRCEDEFAAVHKNGALLLRPLLAAHGIDALPTVWADPELAGRLKSHQFVSSIVTCLGIMAIAHEDLAAWKGYGPSREILPRARDLAAAASSLDPRFELGARICARVDLALSRPPPPPVVEAAPPPKVKAPDHAAIWGELWSLPVATSEGLVTFVLQAKEILGTRTSIGAKAFVEGREDSLWEELNASHPDFTDTARRVVALHKVFSAKIAEERDFALDQADEILDNLVGSMLDETVVNPIEEELSAADT